MQLGRIQGLQAHMGKREHRLGPDLDQVGQDRIQAPRGLLKGRELIRNQAVDLVQAIATGLDQDHDLGLRAQVMKFIQVVDRDLARVPGLDLSQ